MATYRGKYIRNQNISAQEGKGVPFFLVVLAFFYIELFSFLFLSLTEDFSGGQCGKRTKMLRGCSGCWKNGRLGWKIPGC